MLIQEGSVTKHYSMKMYRLLFRRLQRGWYTRTSAPGVLLLTFGKHFRYYVIASKINGHLRPVAWLYLWQKPGWKAWEVMQIFVFEALRGRGLAKRLYSAAINSEKLMIASGKTQSRYSRGLWASFVRNRNFSIFAVDYWNLKDRSQVHWVDGELWASMDVYCTSAFQDRDVRLIAIRKEQ